MILAPGDNVKKRFTTVIYCHFMVIPVFCVIKLYYLGKNCGMAENYHGKKFYNTCPWWQIYNCGNLPWNFNPRKCRH
jgi:hypothetical protein